MVQIIRLVDKTKAVKNIKPSQFTTIKVHNLQKFTNWNSWAGRIYHFCLKFFSNVSLKLVSNAESETEMFGEIRPNCQRTNCSRRVFYEWTTAEFTGTWRLFGMTAPHNSAAVTDVAIHSIHRKRYQSTLLVIHSKGVRCNFWGFLHYYCRRSWWWSSRDGPQHDRSRSETFLISMRFNNCASLAIFFIISVLFCFVLSTKLYIIHHC